MFQRGLKYISARFWTKLLIVRNFGNLNIPNNDTLNKLSLPKFDYPWPSVCSLHANRIEEETYQWTIQNHLVSNDQHHQARVKRSAYGWLIARCYPQGDYLLLRLFSDYHAWVFIVDDRFVDRAETIGPHTIKNLSSILNVVDVNGVTDEKIYGVTAFLDICQRLRARLTDEHYQRFAYGIRLWASSVMFQIWNHMHAQSVGLKSYETYRHYCGGVCPSLDLIHIANSAMLPSSIFYRPEVQELRRIANNIICWTNDINSLIIELHQPGQRLNMVTIYAAQGHSLQQSVDFTAEKTRGEINKFIKLSNVIGSNCEQELTDYITGLKYWLRGYQDWVENDTQRYSHAFAKQDADDRGLPLVK